MDHKHLIATREVQMVLVEAQETGRWHSVFNSLNLAQGHVNVSHYPTFVVCHESLGIFYKQHIWDLSCQDAK